MLTPRGERGVGLGADALERRPRSRRRLRPTGHVKSIVRARKTSESTCAQPLELLVAQDRVVDHELPRVLRRLVEQVALRPDERLLAHHDRLADRVDRRIRHLREELLEVRVEERPPVREHGERRVVPHRADGLLRVRRERRRASPSCPPACSRTRAAGGAAAAPSGRGSAGGRSASRTCSASNQAPYGCGARDLGLHLVVGHDPTLRRDRRGTAGRAGVGPCARPAMAGMSSTPASEASTTQPSSVSSQRPGRRPFRSSVAPITVPVGERDRRRAVPRLGQALVEAVEAAELVRHVAGPRTPRAPSSSARAAASGPASVSSSSTLSNIAVSEPPGGSTGSTFFRSSPKSSDASCDSRARIQLTFPRSVLISPLCATMRYGCASSQLGNVFVLKRECTSASALARRSSVQVGEVARRAAEPTASPCRRASAPRSSGSRAPDRLRARRGAGSRRASARARARRPLVGGADEELPHHGREELRLTPGLRRRTGTSRQPSTSWPSAATVSSSSCSSSARRGRAAAGSRRRRRSRPAAAARTARRAEERVRKLQQDPRAVAGLRIGAGRTAVLQIREHGERAGDRLVTGAAVEPGDAAPYSAHLVSPPTSPDSGLVRRGEGSTVPASRCAGARTWP